MLAIAMTAARRMCHPLSRRPATNRGFVTFGGRAVTSFSHSCLRRNPLGLKYKSSIQSTSSSVTTGPSALTATPRILHPNLREMHWTRNPRSNSTLFRSPHSPKICAATAWTPSHLLDSAATISARAAGAGRFFPIRLSRWVISRKSAIATSLALPLRICGMPKNTGVVTCFSNPSQVQWGYAYLPKPRIAWSSSPRSAG